MFLFEEVARYINDGTFRSHSDADIVRVADCARGEPIMSHSQRLAIRLSAALLAVSAAIVVGAFVRGPSFAPDAQASCNTCSGTFYGVDETKVVNSIRNIWPQGNTNNCGVETAEAVVNFADQLAGLPLRFTSTNDMFQVNSDNQSSVANSEWGYAPVNQWAGKSNIAPDSGTDPRSIAYMTKHYSPPGFQYHDYIYRWSFFHSTEPSFSTQTLEATTSLAESLETWKMPTNTTINGGAHSVLVTGVWSATDPNTSYPAQIRGLVFRDPEYSASSSRFEVDFTTWESTGLYMPPNNYYYSLWKLYYGDLYTINDHKNIYDPEPIVGPYKPNAAQGAPYHWFHGQTWIQVDVFPTSASSPPGIFTRQMGMNVDWAFTATSPGNLGHLMTSP
jgi:hypothetical protein